MATRIVICVDLESDDLETAYEELFTHMAKSGLDWESSDEWYDKNGYAISFKNAQAARMKVFAKHDCDNEL